MEKIICNPLNLEYRYQVKKSPLGSGVFREAADPTMVLFHNTYFLFPSMSGGFWYSDDLYDWQYKGTPELPVYDYAPDVREVNGKIVFCASKRGEKCSIFVSGDPLRDPFVRVSTPLTFWDPDIFQDDDGRVYLYWGCNSRQPIWGIELDAKTMMPVGRKTAIVPAREQEHGWERVGENNALEPPKGFADKLLRVAVGTRPSIEGAFMTKYQGRYYLQYATPWTQHNVYSDGVYIGENPLGPFTYQDHNPFSSKPGGFITAAGHGSTFQDKEGCWWHISTMRVSVNNDYERRVGLFPCDFDEDGILYCNQNFADYPFDICERKGRMEHSPRWMLLSYMAEVETSSWQEGFAGSCAVDENICTNWAAVTDSPEEWLVLDLRRGMNVKAIQVNFADHKLPMPDLKKSEMVKENVGYRKICLEKKRTAYLLEASTDREHWDILRDNRQEDTDFPHDLVVLPDLKTYRYFRLSRMSVPMGGVPAISGLRVFGLGSGELPDQVTGVTAKQMGPLNVLLSWPLSQGAIGYNVRWGISPDKLYSSWQIYDRTELNLSMINCGTTYYAVIDSFNENGVTPGIVVQIVENGGERK